MHRIIEALHQRELRWISDACCGHRKGRIFGATRAPALVSEGVPFHLGVSPGEFSSQEVSMVQRWAATPGASSPLTLPCLSNQQCTAKMGDPAHCSRMGQQPRQTGRLPPRAARASGTGHAPEEAVRREQS